MRKNKKSIKKEKAQQKTEVFQHLKENFKHIYGMWPCTSKFENEAQRM